MNRRREACVRLVVSRGHRSELFEFRKQILDLVSPLVHLAVMIPGIRPVLPRGNHRLRAAAFDLPEQPVRVECLVPNQDLERQILQKLRRPGKAVRLTWKDHEPHKVAERVRNRDDLSGQASPGTADSLAAGPPLAPAAFWCVETMVPSMNTHSKPDSSDNKLNTCSKTPESAQRRNRLNTLFQLPKRAGRSRHGDPAPGPPEHRLKKLPVVRRGDAGVGRLARQHGLDPRPHGVGQHRPVWIHLSFCPSCLRRRSGGH